MAITAVFAVEARNWLLSNWPLAALLSSFRSRDGFQADEKWSHRNFGARLSDLVPSACEPCSR
jgi:hypothetical protein